MCFECFCYDMMFLTCFTVTCFNYWLLRMFFVCSVEFCFSMVYHGFFLIIFSQANPSHRSQRFQQGHHWLLIASQINIKVLHQNLLYCFSQIVCYVWYQRCWTISIFMADHCLSPGDLEIQNLGPYFFSGRWSKKRVRFKGECKLSTRQIDNWFLYDNYTHNINNYH